MCNAQYQTASAAKSCKLAPMGGIGVRQMAATYHRPSQQHTASSMRRASCAEGVPMRHQYWKRSGISSLMSACWRPMWLPANICPAVNNAAPRPDLSCHCCPFIADRGNWRQSAIAPDDIPAMRRQSYGGEHMARYLAVSAAIIADVNG